MKCRRFSSCKTKYKGILLMFEAVRSKVAISRGLSKQALIDVSLYAP